MCGIYGSVNKFSEDIVADKLSKIEFRGPDYGSIQAIQPNSYFGHRRLAIVDLDARSNQPFNYLHLTIVFNGEVYNYAQIKAELLVKGYSFNTNSDTEVICAAYSHYGKACVEHFNGMFSFVIYNTLTKQLFGARDRLGKKPFFYICDSSKKSFEFASQISPLSYKSNLSFDWQYVAEYFFWGYNQDPHTPYGGIKKLPAAHLFIYDIAEAKLEIEKYWDLPKSNYLYTNYHEAKTQLHDLLDDAVKLRLMADVPVGVFLSGGIDSSLITALAQRNSNGKAKTFSISFEENEYDEGKYAKAVAEYLGTAHHEYVCKYDEVIDFIENFDTYFDEPFADMSAIPSLLLAKKTRQEVTVALSGDGGDELFCGYQRYKWMNSISPVYHLPQYFRKLIATVPSVTNNYRLKLIAKGITMDNLFELYVKMVGDMKGAAFNFNMGQIFKPVNAYWSSDDISLYEKMSRFDIKTYLNNDINTKVDRSAMRFSLETRAPIMDYRIAEFSQQIPLHFKVSKGSQKNILKDVLFEHIPAKFFDRPKAGFAMPFKLWFRNNLKSFVMDILTESNLKDIPFVNTPAVKKMIEEHMKGQANHSLEIWKLICWIKFAKSSNDK